ncbi:TPA: hypothetical protein O2724_002001 [Escherichia coli]|uniref:hypothetical protein n=1 Tax=Escherichia coli TaxID=562 RepID=UPI0002CB42BE|nr:hypothetical protein [Escherichia coli]EFW0538903.1 hypothetical protein [Shigella boydii]EFW7509905.1 hypothetical protein [Shigella sonnei]EED1133592.1 hypothetical protein [Escherichia coli]EEQ2323125.1 hypothetical protein [Escherichia coli]EEQ2508285.1 hypothetical protein [Escherichia coli]
MYDTYLNPEDALSQIVVALEAAQFIALDPENTDLAHELIAWALKTAAHASAAQRNTPEVDNA